MNHEIATMNHSIMLIEDEIYFQDLFHAIFSQENLRITCVRCGYDALDHPLHDLYIVDLSLPGMDGLETLKALARKFGEKPNAVLITGFDLVFNDITLDEYGIRKVLPKPFDIARLKKVIRELLATTPDAG